jgi:hypothetical protein
MPELKGPGEVRRPLIGSRGARIYDDLRRVNHPNALHQRPTSYGCLEAVAITGREDYEMAVIAPTTSTIPSSSTACRQVAPVYICSYATAMSRISEVR